LNNIDKIKLAISLLEDSRFNLELENDIIDCLKKILSMLDDSYNKVLINLSRNKVIIFFLAKYMEFSKEDKKHFLVEVLFNIYSSNYEDANINKIVNKINIFDYYYKLS
jgi:hypothetical protein